MAVEAAPGGAQEHVAEVHKERLIGPIALPPELMPTPSTPQGERYGRVPTHWQAEDDARGRVSWITEPGVKKVVADSGVEGTLIGDGYDFLVVNERMGDDKVTLDGLKTSLKTGLEATDGVTGLYYEQLGLGLTNIEQVAIKLRDEDGLRQRIGPEFYKLAEQTVQITFKLTHDIMTQTGKPLSPKLIKQVVSLALDILGVGINTQKGFISAETKTKISKEVAAKLWQEGEIGENDLEFVHSFALTPDAKPKSARRSPKTPKK